MKIGYVGLGKMGYNMALRLSEFGHEVVAHNRSPQKIEQLVEEAGVQGALTLRELVEKLEAPRTIWVMVPNSAVEDVVNELKELLDEGDILIDGGNTLFKDTKRRAQEVEALGINYMDVGVSGGPGGARNGASLMIGGNPSIYASLEPLFKDLATENGYAYMGKHGAGHFVKMVHNGIEYGMMQAIAEGFDVMKQSEFELDFLQIMRPYENGSVITSSLVSWLGDAFRKYGVDLEPISDVAKHSGEGQWTVEVAKEMGINVRVIEDSLQARIDSEKEPNFQAQVVSAMRGEFGGHPVLKNPEKN